MLCAPAAHLFHEGNQVAACFCEGIGDLWRDVASRFSDNDAVFCEFAELCSEDFFSYAGKQVAEFGKALWLKGEVPKREDFPFAGEDVESGFDGATVMRLHRGTPGLQICAYFRSARHFYSMTGRRGLTAQVVAASVP